MILVYDHPEIVAQTVSRIIYGAVDRLKTPNYAIGVVLGEQLIGGVVYHDYDPHAGAIEMSAGFTTPRWATKSNIHAFLSYPFDYVKCQSVFAQTRADNKQTRRLFPGLGFDEVIVPRLFGRDVDGFIYALSDDRWRNSKWCLNGQSENSEAA